MMDSFDLAMRKQSAFDGATELFHCRFEEDNGLVPN